MQNNTSNTVSDLLTAKDLLRDKQRVGFIVPKVLLQELDKVTSKRGKSQFVTRAIAKAIDEKKKGEKERALAKKYHAFGSEASSMAEEWNSFDLKSWDKL